TVGEPLPMLILLPFNVMVPPAPVPVGVTLIWVKPFKLSKPALEASRMTVPPPALLAFEVMLPAALTPPTPVFRTVTLPAAPEVAPPLELMLATVMAPVELEVTLIVPPAPVLPPIAE